MKVLINMMNESGKISRSHGLPGKLLEMQAIRIGIPVLQLPTGWSDYQHNFISLLQKAKHEFDVEEIVFGDIDLQAHRDWEEMVCEKAGVKASLPLWKEDRRQLVMEMLHAGIETTVVSCIEAMGPEYIGRPLSHDLVTELELKGIDPCGENGEFHTVVTNCPLFSMPIQLPTIQPIQHEAYWFSSFGEF